MSGIPDLLNELNNSLADLIEAAEKNQFGSQLVSIEQALGDVVGALESRKREPVDLSGVIDAIGRLAIVVNVSPTPISFEVAPPAITVEVNPTPVHVSVTSPELHPVFNIPAREEAPFRPLVLIIVRDPMTRLATRIEVKAQATA